MILDSFRLDDRVVVVSAASRGIGARIATSMGEVGAKVVVGARSADALEGVAQQIRSAGGEAIAVVGDLSDRAGMDRLVAAAMEHYGQIDAVVNNAGGSGPKAFADTSERSFELAFRWNVTSAFNLSQAALPHLLQSRHANIINIASVAGQFSNRGFAAYGTAKGALIKLTRHMAQDLSPKVRVNAIAPGAIRTSALEGVLNDELEEAMNAGTPLKRIGEVDDIAAAAVYLASDAASYVTGECLAISGGVQGSNLELGLPDL